MLSSLKPLAESALQPVARVLRDVPPNAITLLGLVFPVVFFILLLQGLYGWALLTFLLNGVDLLDGLVARAQNEVTAFGGFLDSTIDRFADFVIIVAFGFAGLVAWPLVLGVLLLSFLTSYIRSRTELAAKGKLVASVGLIERTERLAMIFLGLTAYTIWSHVLLLGLTVLGLTFAVLLCLSLVTVAQRLVFAYRKL